MLKTTRQHLGRGAKIAVRRIDLLLDRIAVTEHPKRIARTTSARWTSFCMHVGLVLETNTPKCRRANSGVSIMEPSENFVSESDGKLPWWNLRRGAKLGGPKTHHRDGNHATRNAKALVPPQDEVTSLLRRKTKTETTCDGDACTRRTGVTCRNGTTNHGHAPPLRVARASAVCAVPCSLRCALCCQVHSSVQCHLFLSTRPPMNAPKRLEHDEIKTRGFADGFRGRAQVQRDQNALVSTGVQNCAKGTHWEAPTASIHGHGDASLFHPNDADRRGAPVLWDTCFYESV